MNLRFTSLLSCFCLVFALSCLGQYYYIFDLITCFYAQFAIGAILFAIHYTWRKHYTHLAVVVLILVASVFKLCTAYPAQEKFTASDRQVKIIQYNINYMNSRVADIAGWIKKDEKDADILIFQEVTEQRAKELEALHKEYPYFKSFPRDDSFGAMIMSKTPYKYISRVAFNEGDVIKSPVQYTQMELLNGTKIYELHALPPINSEYAKDRNYTLQTIAADIAKDPSPNKILVGDFNITAYSHWFQQLVRISGLRNSMHNFYTPGGTWPSMPAFIFRIPIDQLLTSPNIHVISKKLGPDLGSDHLPVVTVLSID